MLDHTLTSSYPPPLRLTLASHKGGEGSESIALLQSCLGPFENENSLINLLPCIYHIEFWKFSFLLSHMWTKSVGSLFGFGWLVFVVVGFFCLFVWAFFCLFLILKS